jgi:hypothetical protein
MNYQKLFDYLSDEHGVTLLESDMSEIVNIVNEMQQAPKWRDISEIDDLTEPTLVLMANIDVAKKIILNSSIELVTENDSYATSYLFRYTHFLILPKL